MAVILETAIENGNNTGSEHRVEIVMNNASASHVVGNLVKHFIAASEGCVNHNRSITIAVRHVDMVIHNGVGLDGPRK